MPRLHSCVFQSKQKGTYYTPVNVRCVHNGFISDLVSFITRRKELCDAFNVDIKTLRNEDVICEDHFNTMNERLSVTTSKMLCETPASSTAESVQQSFPKIEQISLQIEKVFYSHRREFKCDICSQQFMTRDDRNEHINNHFKIHECHSCAQKFVGDRQYRHHTRNRQCNLIKKSSTAIAINDVTVYECYICHKANIFSLRSLKVHINRLHSLDAKPKKQQYSCTICQRTFASIYIMRYHIAEIHTKANQFQCTTCSKQFNRLSNLKLHLLIHENKMPCKCQFCGKSFRTMSGINLHIRTHTGEKPHKCDICNEKAYSYNTDLKRHKRSAHGIVDREFPCGLCEKVFYEPKFLRRHKEKIHSAT